MHGYQAILMPVATAKDQSKSPDTAAPLHQFFAGERRGSNNRGSGIVQARGDLTGRARHQTASSIASSLAEAAMRFFALI